MLEKIAALLNEKLDIDTADVTLEASFKEDLYDVIHSLLDKYGDTAADYTAELTRLNEAIDNQTAMLSEQVSHEVNALQTLSSQLTAIVG